MNTKCVVVIPKVRVDFIVGVLFLLDFYYLYLFVSYLGGMASPCRNSVINKRN